MVASVTFPRPRIAVTGEKVVVTDPLNGKLHLVDAASFAIAGAIPVEGKPCNIVSVGGSGRLHEGEQSLLPRRPPASGSGAVGAGCILSTRRQQSPAPLSGARAAGHLDVRRAQYLDLDCQE